MQIRAADRNDGKTIARVHHDSWTASHADLFPDAFVTDRPFAFFHGLWEAFRADRSTPVMVAIDGGSVMGFVRYSVTAPATTGEIHTLYVDTPHHGHGIGSALLRTAEDALRVERCPEVHVWVASGRTDGVAFYQRRGWTQQHEQEVISLEGANVALTKLTKSLTVD